MLPSDDFSWINNIMVQKDRQENKIQLKAIKERKKERARNKLN
jgi:hypothetical protein